MKIEFEHVDADRLHTTQGPGVRFDLVNKGTAPVRAMLTIDQGVHIGHPSKSGGNVKAMRTLASGLHQAAVFVSATAVDARRDYDFAIAINGVVVVRAAGSVPADETSEWDDRSFQLNVT